MKKTYPNSWKDIKLIPIIKVDKDKNEITNYRTIALIPVLMKIFTKTIKNRLEAIIEENKLLPNNTFGFRKNRDCKEVSLK